MSKQICFYISSFSGGGAERELIYLANEFLSRGYKVDFVVSVDQGPLRSLLHDNVRVICLNRKHLFAEPFLFWRYLVKHKPVSVISSMTIANVSAALVKLIYRQDLSVSWRVVNDLTESRRHHPKNTILKYAPFLHRKLARFVEQIVCVSNGVAADLKYNHHVPARLLKVIHNPAFNPNILQMAKEGELAKEFAQLPAPNFKFVAVGRLTLQKGFDLLLNAFAIVSKEHPQAHLFLLGEGELENDLRTQAKALGIESNVHFLGFQLNPYKYIANSDALVLSSYFEGFGNVIVEALALEVNVIATNCKSGPAEILDNGRFGQLVPVNDKSELARAMISAIETPVQATTLERAQQFSVSNVVDKYEELLFDVRLSNENSTK